MDVLIGLIEYQQRARIAEKPHPTIRRSCIMIISTIFAHTLNIAINIH